jgi:DNA-binding NtrC family response regulator
VEQGLLRQAVMDAIDTVVLVGSDIEWPSRLDDELRRAGWAPTHAESVHHLALLARHRDVRAIVVDARTLSFGDIVTLHRLREQVPAVDLVVVGVGATSEAMKNALDTDATAFVARSQLPALLIDVLRSPRHEAPHAG